MKLKPYAEIIALSPEKLDEALAANRAESVQANAQVEKVKLKAQIINKKNEVQDLCSRKEGINFSNLCDQLDTLALLEHRQKQYDEVLGQLFPTTSKPAVAHKK